MQNDMKAVRILLGHSKKPSQVEAPMVPYLWSEIGKDLIFVYQSPIMFNPTASNNIVAYVVQLETKLLQGLNQAIMDYVQIISHGRRCLDPWHTY